MAKHVGFGRILEVSIWKKCTPLWRQAHLEVKSGKIRGFRTTFGRYIEKNMQLWREAHFEVKSGKRPGVRTIFVCWDREKGDVLVVLSTFRNKKRQSAWCSDHFLTIRWPFDIEKMHTVMAQSIFPSQKY